MKRESSDSAAHSESVKQSERLSAKLVLKQTQEQPSWADTLRQAIDDSGRSGYELAQATGLHQSLISRFRRGHAITLDNAERIGRAVGLELARTRANKN